MDKLQLYKQMDPLGAGAFGEVIKVQRKKDNVRGSTHQT